MYTPKRKIYIIDIHLQTIERGGTDESYFHIYSNCHWYCKYHRTIRFHYRKSVWFYALLSDFPVDRYLFISSICDRSFEIQSL